MLDSLVFAHYCAISLLTLFALAITFSNSVIKISVYFSAFSIISALDYAVLGAPDVSITEVSINACISLAILLSAGYLTGFSTSLNFFYFYRSFIAFILSCGLFFCFLFFVPNFVEFGTTSNVMRKDISYEYIEQARFSFGFHNVVSTILASFRAYDTLGETTVVFSSAMAVISILRVKGKKDGEISSE